MWIFSAGIFNENCLFENPLEVVQIGFQPERPATNTQQPACLKKCIQLRFHHSHLIDSSREHVWTHADRRWRKLYHRLPSGVPFLIKTSRACAPTWFLTLFVIAGRACVRPRTDIRRHSNWIWDNSGGVIVDGFFSQRMRKFIPHMHKSVNQRRLLTFFSPSPKASF